MLQAVGQMQTVCKCHGISGSCTAETCWKRLRPFKETGEKLKGNYYKVRHKPVSRYCERFCKEKVNKSKERVPVHTMKTCGILEVELH
jgi:hypothetical protein